MMRRILYPAKSCVSIHRALSSNVLSSSLHPSAPTSSFSALDQEITSLKWWPSSSSSIDLDDGIILCHSLNKAKSTIPLPEGKKRETIVITHGVMGNYDNFSSWSKRLSLRLNHEYDILLLDLRNHGRTLKAHRESPAKEVERRLTYPSIAHDILKTLDHLDIQDCHLIGHSLGGKAMATLSLLEEYFFSLNLSKKRLNLKTLTVMDISPIPYTLSNSKSLVGVVSILKKLEQVSDKIVSNAQNLSLKQAREIIKSSFVNKELGFFISLSLKDSKENGIKKFEWNFDLEQIVRDLEHVLTFIDLAHPALPPVHERFDRAIPSLFMKGEHSDFLGEKNRVVIGHFFPKHEVVEIQGATHWLHVEKQAETTDIIADFIMKNKI